VPFILILRNFCVHIAFFKSRSESDARDSWNESWEPHLLDPFADCAMTAKSILNAVKMQKSFITFRKFESLISDGKGAARLRHYWNCNKHFQDRRCQSLSRMTLIYALPIISRSGVRFPCDRNLRHQLTNPMSKNADSLLYQDRARFTAWMWSKWSQSRLLCAIQWKVYLCLFVRFRYLWSRVLKTAGNLLFKRSPMDPTQSYKSRVAYTCRSVQLSKTNRLNLSPGFESRFCIRSKQGSLPYEAKWPLQLGR
jgi:hypothetical protein